MAPIEMDYSQLSTCMTCPMKWYLQYVKGLRKKSIDDRDIDKLFGKQVHKSLELYYKLGEKDFVTQWQEFIDLPPESKEFSKTKANGIELCKEYLGNYSTQDSQMEILDVETVMRTPITDSLVWIAKVDTIVKLNNNIYSLEHKTTGKFNPQTYFRNFNPNMQVSGQVYSIEKKYKQCSGCIVNVLVSGYRQKAYKGEPAGFHCKFQREIINRDSRQLLDFKENVKIGTERLLEYSQDNSMIYKNESACSNFRGCQYKEVCLTSFGTELDQEIVDVLYDVVDPKAYLKEGEEPNGTEDASVSA